ncbi:hypothetical protein [Marinitenerispora sediminis]|uniref:Uncharacterized protein n=1 Tax=Marinitenerispora sediminis TaxID=1931232 RepID=A0A368T657_9ACTN|nr:hypothetical protein [Marinitenerispora sediminis]RCV51871.1 hypothetical protein DEF28_14480 [Marinitenerispora sediminis]RCV54806.1 hypothetical protein DEF23_15225 [Marinitenerispora sediminis]RCV58952.1 hypothetical protein DEF24_11545 [Marinitenerispora sediminis]
MTSNRGELYDAFAAFLETAPGWPELFAEVLWQELLAPLLPDGARPIAWHVTIVDVWSWTPPGDGAGWERQAAESAMEEAMRARLRGSPVFAAVAPVEVARRLGFETAAEHGSAVIAVRYRVPT